MKQLNSFSTISLSEMDGVSLMNRLDTKYVISVNDIDRILENLTEHYDILSINDQIVFRYENTYFDTISHKLYTQHHNGKLTRFKIRVRKYCQNGLKFFELKLKNNKGKTEKKRIKVDTMAFNDSNLDFMNKYIDTKDKFKPSLNINFERFTLVNKSKTERITFDNKLEYEFDNKSKEYTYFCIIEIKEDGRDNKSVLKNVLKEHRKSPSAMSKYCFGIASLKNMSVKTNMMKSKKRNIKKYK